VEPSIYSFVFAEENAENATTTITAQTEPSLTDEKDFSLMLDDKIQTQAAAENGNSQEAVQASSSPALEDKTASSSPDDGRSEPLIDDSLASTMADADGQTTDPLELDGGTGDAHDADPLSELATTTAFKSEIDPDDEVDLEPPSHESIIPFTVSPPSPSATPLPARKFKKNLTIDERAVHACEVETFHINVSGKTSSNAKIILERDEDGAYEIEVGGLPEGFDAVFSQNDQYVYRPGPNEQAIKGRTDSSVVCQFNIVNQ
jgi:hypothetical protein